jgi:PAS domain S-box-containing protein
MLEAVFRDAPDGIVVVDGVTSAILECNPAIRIHLGCDPERLIDRPFDALYAPTTHTQPPLCERVRLHGAVLEERELVRIDGTSYLMNLRAWPAQWGDRAVIIVRLQDGRARRHAEAERRSAEAKYRSIFEHAVEGIFQTTPDGRYISANPALARIYGYATPEELIERLTDIAGQLYVDPARRTAFRRLLEENDVVREFESEVYCNHGGVTWISENARAVRDGSGRLRYYEGTVVDISARKRAEQALRTEAEVAHALAHVGREMISALDPASVLERLGELTAQMLACEVGQTWTWDMARDLYVAVPVTNGGTADATATTAAVPRADLADLIRHLERNEVAVLDAAVPELLSPQTRDAAGGAALYMAIDRGGVPVGVLMTLYRRGGGPFTVAQERIARGIAHVASLALEHSRVVDELARANRIKSEFVATISHEFRTPLNIMLGYQEMLLDDGALSTEQGEILERVRTTTRGLAELINATLDVSRLDAGKMTLEVGAVVVSELLAAMDLETRDLVCDRPQLRVRWAVAGELPVVHTDAAKLKIILKNLVHNAVKFTERGSVTVTATPRARGIELAVEDTGIGIAPEALAYVFEAFRQGDGSMTRRHDGVGLGLHLVQRLVELLGGTIIVTSTVGVGSTFRVSLPSHP